MTPGARIQAAIELLSEINEANQPADAVAEAYFRKRRYAGGSDRRAITEQLYDVLRRRARLEWWIARLGEGLAADPRTRMLADLVIAEKMPAEDIEAAFSGAKHCPDKLTAAERRLMGALSGQPLNHPEMPDWVRLEHPEWLDGTLRRVFGAQLAFEMLALNQAAPVDLRANTLRATWEQARDALATEGIEAQPTPLSPLGLRLSGAARIGGTKAFRDGLIEVQDEGSQIVALLTDAQPGMTVIDFCAGAGGKTLALAGAMGINGKVKGRLIACDVSAARIERMSARLKRAGANSVRQLVLESENDKWIDKNQSHADRVLLDVPCTGTGTWRRDPLLRWRLTSAEVHAYVERQRRIMDNASRLVKPKGRLIYATCSILPEENEAQIEWFLRSHTDFSALAIDRLWAETVGGPAPPPGKALRLSPATSGTDGFYVAVLERAT